MEEAISEKPQSAVKGTGRLPGGGPMETVSSQERRSFNNLQAPGWSHIRHTWVQILIGPLSRFFLKTA